MKKIFAKIHLWLSLPLGIVLTVVCLSGAVLVFEGEITRALHPELYQVAAPADARPLQPSQLADRIGEQMPDSLHLVSLQLSARSDEPCMAAFRETGRKQLSVDPYTGNVNGWVESPAFFGTVRKLHRWLLDPPPSKGEKSVGKAIVGVSTLGLVLILVSGLILWIPRSRKALHNRLKVSCSNGRHRFWHDCHVSLGFYATLLLLVMALTGLTWSFGWYRTAAYALFGGTQQTVAAQEDLSRKVDSGNRQSRARSGERTAGREHGETETRPFDHAVWDDVLEQLTAHYTAYKTIVLTQTEAQVTRRSAMRRIDRATFDPRNGRLAEITRYEDTPRQQRLRGWFYTFHTGTWGGIWTKILYFLAALIGATLPLTGYYLWWKRYSNKKNRK
ncbi:PepSY domain-containing protein [Odoribacter sp. Z80]|uniref:PepSY-associated TM helix domain-containing protein n=1 Tax=Odoribacter sp. Z80 TaxID=2304575 RepID=UPI0013797BC4|nr:PepSY-associated TM helix domain-containing protein [Odoribacter sp. Z80]NCE72832.1 PepSY domain-containing protein [Odoribacter sp. Z80]